MGDHDGDGWVHLGEVDNRIKGVAPRFQSAQLWLR